MLVPGLAQLRLEQPAHLRTDPARRMHAVRDVPDRKLTPIRQQVSPHGGRDLAVQAAHPVGLGREAERERRHVERAVRLTQPQGLFRIAADGADPRIEVALGERGIEGLVAGWHGCVGREDGAPRDRFERGFEAFSRVDQLAGALETEQRDVALVHVPDRGAHPQRTQRANTPDAQHDFLAKPHLATAHVEDARDGTIGGVVDVQVGVEQQHRDETDLGFPHLRLHYPTGQVDRHDERPAASGLEGQKREAVEVVVGIDVLLIAVGIDGLAKIARAVEQGDTDQRHAEIARRLAVVASEHAEASRVDPQRLVNSELHREIRDRPRQSVAGLVEPARRIRVGVHVLDDRRIEASELGITEQGAPALASDADQQLHRVAVALPVLRVDLPEQALGRRRPAPPEVVGELPQAQHLFRQLEVGGLDRP